MYRLAPSPLTPPSPAGAGELPEKKLVGCASQFPKPKLHFSLSYLRLDQIFIPVTVTGGAVALIDTDEKVASSNQ